MPKPRGRRHRRHHRTTPRRSPRTHLGLDEAIAALPLLQATDAAEARGDAWGALELIERDLEVRRDSNFWRPERLQRLTQIAWLSSMLPGWAISRWILAQAAQTLDQSARRRGAKALEIALAARGGDSLPGGMAAVDAKAKVMDHDWVFRQVLLYELGGLQHFVARVASPDLLVGADRIHDWARTPMAAFRFVRESTDALTWVDLGSGEAVRSLNLGAASLLVPGECAIGRLAPIEGGVMFESVPLLVPCDVATRVAEDPPGWVDAVSSGRRRPRAVEEQITPAGHDFRVLTDVPVMVEQVVVLITLEHADGEPPTIETPADWLAARVRLVRLALDGRLDDSALPCSPWPTLAAMLTYPDVVSALSKRLRPTDGPKLDRLADLLVGPGQAVCGLLAREAESAA